MNNNENSTREFMSMRNLVARLLNDRKSVWLYVFLTGSTINLIAIGTALYSMQVYDRVLPRQGTDTLIVLTIGVLLAYCFQYALQKLRSRIVEHIVSYLDKTITAYIYEALLKIRLDVVPVNVGTFSSQLQGYEAIRGFFVTLFSFGIVDAPYALLFLFALFLLSGPLVAAIPAVIFMLMVIYGVLQHYRIRTYSRKKFTTLNRKQGLLLETIQGLETIKTNNIFNALSSRWNNLSTETLENDIGIRHISESTAYTAQFFQQVGYALVVAAGAALAATTTNITSGAILASSIIAGRILAPIASIPMLLVQAAQAKVAENALNQFLKMETENQLDNNTLSPDILNGEWWIEGMTFQFPDRHQLLQIPRLKVEKGERIGIIGPVGAGKSTLLKLLVGLYPQTSGQIHLDGLDIRHISRESLSDAIAYLPQSPTLFAGTLRSNFQTICPEATEQDILNISKATGLIELITNNPKGLDLVIGEKGDGLSAGQQQLISLSIILLRNKQIWLFDEPTSSLDPESEKRVIKAINNVMTEHSVMLMVTHKFSTLELVNRLIIVTADGQFIDGQKSKVLDYLKNRDL
ncbi:ATP-binding cassette domain-containing protein [Citrobacter portucalensis]|uniref:ATP-binding cassette domain-containing protein n=1 Tax=Citrobacter portucalensis TaxID=1639133 RepID=A0AAW5WDU3_9ENTR|nr:ATP-binding cassette domain-containing protein [Citrobacter portucalensis]MCX9004617.1 ATP-binding cassette domain-containing protein [Citrobacter portucalensis]